MAKGADIAARFEQANEGFIRTLEGLSDEHWGRTCEETGWTVGVTAHHVAESHATLAQLINSVAEGATPGVTPDMIDSINAEHAQRAANASRDETVQLARANGAQAAQTLRGLKDEQLQRTLEMPLPTGPQTVTAEAVAQNVLIGHIGMHLPMIEKAVS